MKKGILIYLGVIYSFTLIATLFDILSLKFDIIFFFLHSLLVLICVYNLFKKKFIEQSLYFLILSNFLQSVRFLVGGVYYIFIQGVDYTFQIYKIKDWMMGLKLETFRLDIGLGIDPDKTSMVININLIQLFLFVNLVVWYREIIKEKMK
ncbi:hypothetical protein [Mucilaginibacter polytrichastri]|uniref:Uncharacterized protein n=1 Tax=Mucilaginibacter polytrichastri TaxID=1302689 RepID=A0A1Q5ZVC1_9SPHI|nr:hypothetical protein [Mucilaginibacter polytrichastri]OKS85721.1 hypothetical protein RG47T_1167 [Mucilaginibacter polytrichastri]SFS61846.1 hypothetical protein SAMN04487890_102407 [Mucilaginibacter polytrichastri]